MDRVPHRARLHQSELGGAAGHGLERGGQADHRLLLFLEARMLLRLEGGDDRDPAFRRGQIGFRRLDPCGQRFGGDARAVRLVGRPLRGGLELLIALRRLLRLAPRLLQSCGLGPRVPCTGSLSLGR